MHTLKPFTDNIIFIDTEFSSLDPYEGELLSIGMVKMTGEEFYVELEYDGACSDWVKEHILESLTGEKISREQVVNQIIDFVGKGNPFVISYVNSFDTVYLYKLFGMKGHGSDGRIPFHWITLDFASVLFGAGYDPGILSLPSTAQKEFYVTYGIDVSRYREHHALDDARMLRDIYKKFISE